MSTCELTRATRISDVRGRDRVRVMGTIISAQTTAIGSSLAYRCVLADGTGELDLLFLGRAAIAGLAAGARCCIEGVVAARGGRVAVWNPRYQVQPAEAPPVTDVESSPADAGAGGACHFRVYLSAAPGAGKTIAMLDEGQRRRVLGADVVIAVIEDHDRPLTRAHAAGLEMVPRRASEYHGARFEEMNLDGVLDRNPGVALADELDRKSVV